MKESFRWFGPSDPVSLKNIRQVGATTIVSALHEISNGDVWSIENIQHQNHNNKINRTSNFKSFQIGFFTNVLNPKATLFFLSLYATIITDQTTMAMQAIYGAWMALITGLWFCLLSIILTNKSIIEKIRKFVGIIQKGTGIILIAFAVKLLFSNQ